MEQILNFQVPAEGLEMVILLRTQYVLSFEHHKLTINDDSHPIFLSYINPICPLFPIKSIFLNFHF